MARGGSMPSFSSDRKAAANQPNPTKSIGPKNTPSTQPNRTNHEQQGSLSVFPSRQSAVAIESTQQRETATAPTREIEFAILPDGRIVDLIRNLRQPSKIEFLVWQDGTIRLTSHIEHDGELLVVPKMDPTVLSALRLPTMPTPPPEIHDCFTRILNYIETYVDITPQCNPLAHPVFI